MSAGAPLRAAVVDIGSNSIRLLLCERIGPDGAVGPRRSTVIGLRRGAAPDGTLADDALARLDTCLADYAAAIAPFAPERVVAAGTSAVRDAPNGERVAELARGRLGAELRVLSGDQEARASFAGARLAAEGEGPVLVIDIGGGSTELVRGGPDGPAAALSLQLGAVRHTERHLLDDPPDEGQQQALRAEARDLIAPALERIGGPAPAIAVAGTATTLAAIELGGYDPERVHRHRLTAAGVEALASRLAALPLAERREVPGLEPNRAGVIVAGALILATVLECAGLDSALISERDLLDGLALDAAGAIVL